MARDGLAGDFLNELDVRVAELMEGLTKTGSWEDTLKTQGRIQEARRCKEGFQAFLTRYYEQDEDD